MIENRPKFQWIGAYPTNLKPAQSDSKRMRAQIESGGKASEQWSIRDSNFGRPCARKDWSG